MATGEIPKAPPEPKGKQLSGKARADSLTPDRRE